MNLKDWFEELGKELTGYKAYTSAEAEEAYWNEVYDKLYDRLARQHGHSKETVKLAKSLVESKR